MRLIGTYFWEIVYRKEAEIYDVFSRSQELLRRIDADHLASQRLQIARELAGAAAQIDHDLAGVASTRSRFRPEASMRSCPTWRSSTPRSAAATAAWLRCG
jgi:hypothetical protein